MDDVRKTVAEMKARGVKFLDAQPREEGWGFSAGLVDPDGNHFTIHETRKPSATADWAKSGKKAYRTNNQARQSQVGLDAAVVNMSA